MSIDNRVKLSSNDATAIPELFGYKRLNISYDLVRCLAAMIRSMKHFRYRRDNYCRVICLHCFTIPHTEITNKEEHPKSYISCQNVAQL